MKAGDRVIAILSADDKTIKVIGRGVYDGDKVPPKGIRGFGDLLNEAGIPNPCIRLDDGKTVYGCECWWGPEENADEAIAGRQVINVDIDKVRSQVE